jgi:hypothetical protein
MAWSKKSEVGGQRSDDRGQMTEKTKELNLVEERNRIRVADF